MPRISTDLSLKSLSINEDSFATLVDVQDNKFVYDISYVINSEDVVSRGLKGVKVSILSEIPDPEPTIFTTVPRNSPRSSVPPRNLRLSSGVSSGAGEISSKSLSLGASSSKTIKANTIIDNILLSSSDLKNQKENNKKKIIKSHFSDPTANLDNSVSFKANSNKSRTFSSNLSFSSSRTRSSIKLKLVQPNLRNFSSRTATPVFQTNSLKLSSLSNSKKTTSKLSLSLISKGVDPTQGLTSNFVRNTFRSVSGMTNPSSSRRRSGLKLGTKDKTSGPRSLSSSRKKKKKNKLKIGSGKKVSPDELSHLQELILDSPEVRDSEDLELNSFVPIVVREQEPNTETITTFIIPDNLIEGDNFYVKFELFDLNDVIVEQSIKRVQHSKIIKIFFTPNFPPEVRLVDFRKIGANSLEIRQIDPVATSIRIYRKRISPDSQVRKANYEFVQEIDLEESDGTINFIDVVNNGTTIIYRVIPIGPNDQVGSIFSNIVAVPAPFKGSKKNKKHLFSVVVAQPSLSGIDVRVSNVSSEVSFLKVFRKDLTLHEKQFTTISHKISGNKIIKVGENSPSEIFVDTEVKFGHIYEYCAVFIFPDGKEEISTGCDTIEYIPFSEGLVKIVTSEPEIINSFSSVDVQFDIESIIEESNLDRVKKALERQGLLSLFETSLEKERGKLQSLISHKIKRINLTTGAIEHFPTFSEKRFSDEFLRERGNVSPLESGNSYLYFISTLLRVPETMFEDVEKEVTDSRGRTYTFKPNRFLHPLILSTGAIVNTNSILRNHSKDEFGFGNIGNIHEVSVSLESLFPEISNAKVKNIGGKKNVVTWNVRGDKNLIDHFIIIQRRMRMEEIVGTVHPITDSNLLEFIDLLEEDEIGEMDYRIVPVYNNYKHGSESKTNKVIV